MCQTLKRRLEGLSVQALGPKRLDGRDQRLGLAEGLVLENAIVARGLGEGRGSNAGNHNRGDDESDDLLHLMSPCVLTNGD